ncbi:iron-siderophore ABC transporter substrate-binding protein [Paenibacillus sp. P96]|uniref:Iron-siderophore ABC transporter substrate-binding protein n=1 Tax=Paenibacillus zeirhizosphaerae TaxID=2987519 RepID=A0ABT9FQM3_9BACL|nr:iron-siderophore ABC transporter substrate-binding protein [Paenibacillus sp. P96]MDP4097034.1 iron-siderophore ABC transporter substrate-binding protein [Paenibacillus sp. P96]
MHIVKSSAFLIILLFAVILSACGAQNTATEGGGNAAEGSNGTSQAQETRTFKDAMGEISVTGVPERVVVLDWTAAEDVLALGMQPVGITDIEGMKKWVNVPLEIGGDVTDIGDRSAPNMELIASLKPDLILGLKSLHEANYDALKAIAPTLLFNPYPEEGQGDQYEDMEKTFLTIADVLDKNTEAQAVLDDLQQTYETAKKQITEAGADQKPFVLAMAFTNQNAVTFRLSTDNALAVKTLERIGLKNAYQPKQFELYGFTTTDVEALPALQDANFIHIIQDDDNVIENQLKDNPVWNGLNFVKENRVYALGGDTWPYGGPLSAKVMAEKAADLLTK